MEIYLLDNPSLLKNYSFKDAVCIGFYLDSTKDSLRNVPKDYLPYCLPRFGEISRNIRIKKDRDYDFFIQVLSGFLSSKTRKFIANAEYKEDLKLLVLFDRALSENIKVKNKYLVSAFDYLKSGRKSRNKISKKPTPKRVSGKIRELLCNTPSVSEIKRKNKQLELNAKELRSLYLSDLNENLVRKVNYILSNSAEIRFKEYSYNDKIAPLLAERVLLYSSIKDYSNSIIRERKSSLSKSMEICRKKLKRSIFRRAKWSGEIACCTHQLALWNQLRVLTTNK